LEIVPDTLDSSVIKEKVKDCNSGTELTIQYQLESWTLGYVVDQGAFARCGMADNPEKWVLPWPQPWHKS
jgi:hypothetical protein